MSSDAVERIRKIKRFDQLVAYLRDELEWPIETEDFEDLTYDWEPDELGIDLKTAAKIQEIKQLRPLASGQDWGIFFVKFEPRRLPIVAMRRLLNSLVLKNRPSARSADRASWKMHDLLFVSEHGQGDQRKITFAHFAESEGNTLPTLKVLDWDDDDEENGDADDDRTMPITQLETEDLMVAFRQVFDDGTGRDRDAAIRAVARQLGYARDCGSTDDETRDLALRRALTMDSEPAERPNEGMVRTLHICKM